MDTTRSGPLLPEGVVLVGTDGSAGSGPALDWAADHAAAERRPLAVVYATGTLGTPGTTWLDTADPATSPALQEIEREGRVVVDAAMTRITKRRPALTVIPLVVMEDPVEALVRLSNLAGTVVVGTRTPGLVHAVTSDHVGPELARRAGCPVVVVPAVTPTPPLNGVLVGVSTTRDPSAALDFAYRQASFGKLPLNVVHVSPVAGDEGREIDRRRLSEAIAGYEERFPDVRVRLVQSEGRPLPTLLGMAEKMHLLVVGRHHPTGVHESPFGHVRSSVVDQSTQPVAVVPDPVAVESA